MKWIKWVGKSLMVVFKNLDLCAQIIAALAVAILGFKNIATVQDIQSATIVMLGILAFSLLRNRGKTRRIEKSLKHLEQMNEPPKSKTYATQDEVNEFLIDYIRRHHVSKATLVQYSCTSAKHVLKTLVERGAEVTVYIQDEKTARKIGSREQAVRIVDLCNNLPGEIPIPNRRGKLTMRKFHAPASLSGIKFDGRLLAMGWYTYEHVDNENRSPTPAYREDSVQVSGHDVATILVWEDTPEFEALDKTFTMLVDNYRRNSEEVLLI